MQKFARLFKNESGATAIEYGLIAALIAVAIIGAVGALGSSTSGQFNNIANAIADPASAT
ncbi:Flp family type IVb pilin [Henriciella aquimarina]|uniref:Flp family type IVb pilin n=1 Tax=Henriciella aquimarina TaxID=545261 RepID=UPI000A007719|nr:Flp family type IVb pilin [Henriciella aquimarina]